MSQHTILCLQAMIAGQKRIGETRVFVSIDMLERLIAALSERPRVRVAARSRPI